MIKSMSYKNKLINSIEPNFIFSRKPINRFKINKINPTKNNLNKVDQINDLKNQWIHETSLESGDTSNWGVAFRTAMDESDKWKTILNDWKNMALKEDPSLKLPECLGQVDMKTLNFYLKISIIIFWI